MYYGLPVPNILVFLSLLVLGGVSYLIWWKAKAPAALLMLVGFGVCWLVHFLMWIHVIPLSSYEAGSWLFSLGLAVAALGFVLTFWTRIQGDVERLRAMAREKLSQAAKHGAGEVPAPPPPEPTEKP